MVSPTGCGNRLWVRRVGWLILIWTLSVTALGIVAVLLRTFMNIAGLTSGR
jgi:Protein of unknown function (DUF2474)